MNRLPVLRAGDIVDVVAPASACPPAVLERGVRMLRDWGLVARVPVHIFGPPDLVAQEDGERWRQLRRALYAGDSRAVWCVRGGYGVLRLMPRLERCVRPVRPKLVIGFSDITLLHQHCNERWGWSTLHASNLGGAAGQRLRVTHRRELRRVVFGETTSLVFRGLRALNPTARATGVVRAPLTGGNMKTLQSLLGTPSMPRWRSRIVVLEDVGERAYSVDRMLEQFRNAGLLRGVRAMVLGDFTGGEEPDGARHHAAVFTRFARSVRFPVLEGLPVGHGERMRPLPLHMTATLHTGPRASLCMEWHAQRSR